MAKSAAPLAVIITPTYNERPNIQKLVPAVAKVIATITDWQVKLLVVDDSSPDGTANAVRELAKQYPFLELLVNEKKSGLGGAYLKGMEKAFSNMKADAVFEMDADLSHDPKKVPSFLAALDAGADFVLGSRYISGGSIPSNWGLHRKFLSVIGNMVISVILTSRVVSDWTTGYRAIRRKVYEAVEPELHAEQFSGYTFQIGFLHKAIRKRFVIQEIPFHFIDRTEGESKIGTEYIINTLKYLISVRIKEILASRLAKFVVVGGIGFLVNLAFYRIFASLHLWDAFKNILGMVQSQSKFISNESVGVVLGAEVAIVSNYILNNFWTFKDRKITGLKHVAKFAQFNASSIGSVAIQYVVVQGLVALLGTFVVLSLAGFGIASDNFYLILGVLLGMIWNFTVYTLVIWKK